MDRMMPVVHLEPGTAIPLTRATRWLDVDALAFDDPLTGAPTRVLVVKGSGGDLGTLTAGKSGPGSTFWSWTAGGASNFDLVRGDLGTLLATSGDFKAALDALPPGLEDLAL